MSLILLIETSGKNCSVALAENGVSLACVEASSPQYIHAEKLHPFVGELFLLCNRKLSELSAVAVSKGPGSYTGLRIGVSAAKGFCFAAGIPLIAIETTLILAYHGKAHYPDHDVYAPMIDARRMEVYTAQYDLDLSPLDDIAAIIVDDTFTDRIKGDSPLFIGDGSHKVSGLPGEKKWVDILPSASMMAAPAQDRLTRKQFENLAYFEPFYLKEFVAGKPASE